MKNLFGPSSDSLACLSNPFKSDCITGVRLYYYKQLFGGPWLWHGTVEFSKGSTSGEQKFENESFTAIEKKCNLLLIRFNKWQPSVAQ